MASNSKSAIQPIRHSIVLSVMPNYTASGETLASLATQVCVNRRQVPVGYCNGLRVSSHDRTFYVAADESCVYIAWLAGAFAQLKQCEALKDCSIRIHVTARHDADRYFDTAEEYEEWRQLPRQLRHLSIVVSRL